jgi:hypothetical protein
MQNRANYWGEPDDEPLPDWMDPVKCRQLNEQKELRRKTGRDLNSVIQEALNQPSVPITIQEPKL